MDKEGIIKRHRQLLENDENEILMNPIEQYKSGYLVYNEYFIGPNEVSDLADLLLSMLEDDLN